jgi:hypothetical protein
MLQIQCPACGRALELPETMTGQQVRCPLCQNVFRVGGAAAPAVQPMHPTPGAPGAEFDFGPSGGRPAPRGPEQDFPFTQGGMEGIRARSLGRRGAAAMQRAFVFDLLAYLFFVLLQIFADTSLETKVITILLVTVFYAVPVIFITVGAGQLSQGRGQGLVITGCVMAFIAALELLLYAAFLGWVVLAALNMNAKHGILLFAGLFVLWCLVAVVMSILGGIQGLTTLSRREPRDGLDY